MNNRSNNFEVKMENISFSFEDKDKLSVLEFWSDCFRRIHLPKPVFGMDADEGSLIMSIHDQFELWQDYKHNPNKLKLLTVSSAQCTREIFFGIHSFIIDVYDFFRIELTIKDDSAKFELTIFDGVFDIPRQCFYNCIKNGILSGQSYLCKAQKGFEQFNKNRESIAITNL